MTTLDKITLILKKLPHKTQVSFALYCAKDVYPLIEDKDLSLKAKACIDLTEKWLNDEVITKEELRNAANAAYTTSAAAAAYTAYAAANAAANAAAYANAAANATDNAAYAAYAAANTAYDISCEKKLIEYLKWFKLSKLECLIYDLND